MKSIKQEPISHGLIKPYPPIPKIKTHVMIWWCGYTFIIINKKPFKWWQNTSCYLCPNSWYNHPNGFRNQACNEPMSGIFVNPPTITRLLRNIFARNGRWDCHLAPKTRWHHFTCRLMYHVSTILFDNQVLSSINIWYTSLMCTTNIDFPIPNDQSFHGSSTTNSAIGKTKLGNANIDCQIYPYPCGVWNWFPTIQKTIIFLRDSKIETSTFTKPNFPFDWIVSLM